MNISKTNLHIGEYLSIGKSFLVMAVVLSTGYLGLLIDSMLKSKNHHQA